MSASDVPLEPPPHASDYYAVAVGNLQELGFVDRLRRICQKLRSYSYDGEQIFTTNAMLVLSLAISVRPTDTAQALAQHDDQGAGEDRIFAALQAPDIQGMASIRGLSRGYGASLYENTRIQRWVRDSLVGSSMLRGNHMPDIVVSLGYADQTLISLVGEDGIIKRTNKRNLDGETLFVAVPTAPMSSSAFALPHEQQLALVWAKKMARLHLYLLSTFEAFGCRLGLLRIHQYYGRLYLSDARTILVECDADYLALLSGGGDTPTSVTISAARFLQNEGNYRHLPHEWKSDVASIEPMINQVHLAHDMLLMTPLIDPLPPVATPGHNAIDALVPEPARLTSTARTGIELYQCLGVERGGGVSNNALRSESVPEQVFHAVFDSTSQVWSSTETESSIDSKHSSSGSDGPGDDGPGANSPDGSDDPGDGPGSGESGPHGQGGPPSGHGPSGHGPAGGSGPVPGPTPRGPTERHLGNAGGNANEDRGSDDGHPRSHKRAATSLADDAHTEASMAGSFAKSPRSKLRRMDDLNVLKQFPELDHHSHSDDAHAQRFLLGSGASETQPTAARRIARDEPLCAASDDGDLLRRSAAKLHSEPPPSSTRRVVSDPLPLPVSAGSKPTGPDLVYSTAAAPASPLPPSSSPAMAVRGLDKARFLDLESVRSDARIQPPASQAFQRALEDETEYEAAESQRSIRDHAVDFAAQVAALERAGVKVKLVSAAAMDQIVQHLSNAIAGSASAAGARDRAARDRLGMAG